MCLVRPASISAVVRVRAREGGLWAQTNEGVTIVDPGSHGAALDDSPWRSLPMGDRTLRVPANGIAIGSRTFVSSNDAFGLDIHPIEGIVDMVYDPESGFAWLCTREHGLFKLRWPR